MEPRAAPPATAAAEFALGGTRLAASPAPPSSSRAAATIVALSEDPTLLEALTLAAIEQAAVVTSPSADRFVDQLVANGAEVALIDAACAPSPLEDFVASLHEQFPQLLLLIAGPPPLQHQLAAQLADGAVFRFAHKPASAQRLKLFVNAALRRRQALGEPTPASLPASASSIDPRKSAGGPRHRLLRAAALLLTLGTVSALALLRPPWHIGSAGRPAPVNPGPAASVAPAGPADAGAERDRLLAESRQREAALLEQVRRTASGARAEQAHVYVDLARKRLASGALLQPSDDSARDYVRAAVALAPDDTDVRAAARALGDALIAAFRQAIADGDEAAARRWLQACDNYHVNAATQAQLASQLEALQRARDALSERSLALQRAFDQRLEQGQLLEPGDDSALANYRLLKNLAPDDPALPAMLRTLRSALAAGVQARLARNDVSGAEQRLRAARDAGVGGDELANAAAALERARAAASAERTAAAGAATGTDAATAGTSTTTAATSETAAAVVPESDLQRVHFVAPVYPPDALAHGVTGSVDLEFTVTSTGQVRDIQVQSAEPPGVFEQAAISALSHSRYMPVERDGAAVAQRARVKIRFTL